MLKKMSLENHVELIDYSAGGKLHDHRQRPQRVRLGVDRTERPSHRRYPQRYPPRRSLGISNHQALTLRSLGVFNSSPPGLEGRANDPAASGDEISALREAVNGQFDQCKQELPS